MAGGQGYKYMRRFILPSLAGIFTALKDKKARYKGLYFLSLIGVLSAGYGEHSKIRKLFKGSDFWTRIFIGLLVSIPFVLMGKWYAVILLPVAYSIRAGGFKITEHIDWLWEDFIRFLTIGILVVI